MATADEKLRLDVEVSYDGDALERFEDGLEQTERQIAETGDGRDDVRLDVDAFAADAIAELEAINATLERIEDDKQIDVEVDREINDTVNGAGGATAMTSGGRPDASELLEAAENSDVRNRMSGGVADSLLDTLDERLDKLDSGSTREDRRAVANELLQQSTTANPATEFEGPFGVGKGTSDERQTENMIRFLEGDDPLDPVLRDKIEAIKSDDIFDEFDTDMDVVERRQTLRKGYDIPMVGMNQLADQGMNWERFPDPDDDGGGFFRLLSDQLDGFTDSFLEAEFTIEDFHKIFASMVPLMVVFIGSLPAAISALVGLAGAAIAATVAMGGLAALGVGGLMLTESGSFDTEILLERLRGVFDAFVTAFSPLMRSLDPVVNDAITDIENMAGPLSSAANGLMRFRSEFGGVVDYVTGRLPQLLASTLAFAEVMQPTLAGIFSALDDANILAFFAAQTERLTGTFAMLDIAVTNLLPAILLLSEGFLRTVGFLLMVGGAVAWVAKQFPLFTSALGTVISLMLVALSITTLLTIAQTPFVQAVLASTGALLKQAAAAFLNAAGFQATTLSVIAFYSALTLGIAGVVAFTSAFDSLKQSIGLTNSALKNFNELSGQNVGGNIGVGSASPTGGSGGSNPYTTVINADGKDSAARQQYASDYERTRHQHVDSVFGG